MHLPDWPASLMWYRSPAPEWKEGLPIGNGRLAGMLLGGPTRERLALNHEWLWRSVWRQRTIGPRHQHLARIRQLFFEGKLIEAGQLANEKLGGLGGVSGVKNRVDPYQPAGDLWIEHAPARVDGYRRQLDLDRAVATVEYQLDSMAVSRQYLAHSRWPVIAVRIKAAQAIAFTLQLARIKDPDCRVTTWNEGSRFGLEGVFREGARFAVDAKVVTAGQVTPAADGALSMHADEALVLLSIAVDHDGNDPAAEARTQLETAPTRWSVLLDQHVEQHRSMYRRVSLQLGDDQADTPTDQRVAKLRAGQADEGMFALYANYGRYLLISSSPAGSLVMNLQGKWNEELNPPWECDLHQDVNIQMHYWPAEVCNLPETVGPLLEHVERFVPHGREMARALYNCRGIFLPIQTDPWGRATPESRGWDVWTGAAAWVAQHFWWRYEFSLDREFLRTRAYPLFKEVAAFYEDYLVEHPTRGWLVTVPSQSPENTFKGGTTPVSLCVAATMDLQLIRDVLDHAIEASELLQADAELRAQWREILAKLPPYQVGRHGQLQEWLEDYEEGEPGHRHMSHLFALYPGDEFTLEGKRKWFDAARVSLERRLASDGGHTGWSRAWTVCFMARLGEPEKAHYHLTHLITDFATSSLLDLHPPRIFQIDGNLGGTAGVIEMLLQSHRGLIRLLPALPAAWATGHATGLAARGGFTLDLHWEQGQLTRLVVRSQQGQRCRLQLPPGCAELQGLPAEATQAGGVIEFATTAGANYELISLATAVAAKKVSG